MKNLPTWVKYTVFALISTGCNIGAQWLVKRIFPEEWSIYIAIPVGTGIGLLVKYVLDKLFIFYYETSHIKEDIGKFILYSLMGIVTTGIFWGTEFLFHFLIPNENSMFIGAVIGLAIGYTVKYFLDKKFVFVKQGNSQDS